MSPFHWRNKKTEIDKKVRKESNKKAVKKPQIFKQTLSIVGKIWEKPVE